MLVKEKDRKLGKSVPDWLKLDHALVGAWHLDQSIYYPPFHPHQNYHQALEQERLYDFAGSLLLQA